MICFMTKYQLIYLLDLVFLKDPLLLLVRTCGEADLDGHLVALGRVDHAFHKPALLQWDPAGSLRVIGLERKNQKIKHYSWETLYSDCFHSRQLLLKLSFSQLVFRVTF